jgi:hypothetical protein
VNGNQKSLLLVVNVGSSWCFMELVVGLKRCGGVGGVGGGVGGGGSTDITSGWRWRRLQLMGKIQMAVQNCMLCLFKYATKNGYLRPLFFRHCAPSTNSIHSLRLATVVC